MTISVWPVDAVNGAPQYSGRKLRQTTNAPFLSGASSSRPLGARSGVRPGTSSSTVTATSTTVTVGAFAGVIDGEAAAEAGPYTFASDTAVTFTSSSPDPFPAANASNARVDIVYVQISDPAEADGSTAPGVAIRYLAGSPAASPVAPDAPARSFVVAQVTVPKTGGGSPSVSWVAPYAVAAGGVMPVPTLAMLRTLTGSSGQFATVFADLVTFNNGLYQWNPGTNRWDTTSSPTKLMNWSSANGGSPWGAVTGFQPIMQMGQFQGTLPSNAVGTVTFSTPFPNGFSVAWLIPHRNSGTDTSAPPLMQEDGASKNGFRFFAPGRASATVFIPWVAIGW